MTTCKEAEKYIQDYFHTSKGITLIRCGRGETGFGFRDESSSLFVEVKGSKLPSLAKIPLRYFTDAEYQKAAECRRDSCAEDAHNII